MQVPSRSSSRFAALIVLSTPAFAQSTFHVVPDLPGGTDYVELRGVSADGSTVVGTSDGSIPFGGSGLQCITWTVAGGTVSHGDLAGGPDASHGNALSGTGAHYAGRGSVASGEHAHKDMVDLGSIPGLFDYSVVNALSDDGVFAVGTSVGPSGYEACVWNGALPPFGLGDFAGGYFESYANDVSGDGHVVVGTSHGASGYEAFYRDLTVVAGTLVGLGDLPGGGFNSRANTCSLDGSVIWGEGDDGSGSPRAFQWTASTGMLTFPGTGTSPHACTADGRSRWARRSASRR